MPGRTRTLDKKIINALHQHGEQSFTELKNITHLNDMSLSRNLHYLLETGQILRSIQEKHRYYRLTQMRALKEVKTQLSEQIKEAEKIYCNHRTALFIFGKELPLPSIEELPENDYGSIAGEALPILPYGTELSSPDDAVTCIILSRIYSQTTADEREDIAKLFGKIVWTGYLLTHPNSQNAHSLSGVLSRITNQQLIFDLTHEWSEYALKTLGFTSWQYHTQTLDNMVFRSLFDFSRQRDWLTEASGQIESTLTVLLRKEVLEKIKILHEALRPVNIVYVWSSGLPETTLYSLLEHALIQDFDSWLKVLRQGELDDRLWIFTEGERDLEKFISWAEQQRDFSKQSEVPQYAIDIDPCTHTDFIFRNHPRGNTIELFQEMLNAIKERKILRSKSARNGLQ